jgi:hypothetical protein
MFKKITITAVILILSSVIIAQVEDDSPINSLIAKIKGNFDKERQKADTAYEKKVRPVIERADKQRRASIRRAGKKALARLEKAAKTAIKTNNELEVELIDEEIAAITKLMEENEPAMKPKEVYRVRFGGHKYLAILAPVNWAEAKKICEKMGGHLAYIETAEEMAFIQKLTSGPLCFWVGATDEPQEGDWRWLNKRKVNPVFWHPNEPNGRRRENYVWLSRGRLVDCGNTRTLNGFICEWDR